MSTASAWTLCGFMLLLSGACFALASSPFGDAVAIIRVWWKRIHDVFRFRLDIRELYAEVQASLASLLWLTTLGAVALATASGVSYARFARDVPFAGTLFVSAALIGLATATLLVVDYAAYLSFRAWRICLGSIDRVVILLDPDLRAIAKAGSSKPERFAAELDARDREARQLALLANYGKEFASSPALVGLSEELNHRHALSS